MEGSVRVAVFSNLSHQQGKVCQPFIYFMYVCLLVEESHVFSEPGSVLSIFYK